MFCTKCGKSIDDTSKFCPECGAVIEQEEPKPAEPVTETPQQQPVQPQVLPQEPVQPQVPPQQPVQSQVPPQQPVQSQVPPQESVQSQVPPQQPVQPQVPPQQPMMQQPYMPNQMQAQYAGAPNYPNQMYNQNPEGVLRKFSYSAKLVRRCLSTIILCIVIGVLSMYFVINGVPENNNKKEKETNFTTRLDDDDDDEANGKLAFLLLALICVISACQSVSSMTQAKKLYLCICRDGVFGEARRAFGSGTKTFKIAYEDIKKVTCSGDKLVIKGKGSCKLYIDNAKDAKKMIRHALEGHTPTAMSQF